MPMRPLSEAARTALTVWLAQAPPPLSHRADLSEALAARIRGTIAAQDSCNPIDRAPLRHEGCRRR